MLIANQNSNIFLFLALIGWCGAKIYIVDGNNGNDDNPGDDVDLPFKTIQQCVDVLKNPGDECQIRSGRLVHISLPVKHNYLEILILMQTEVTMKSVV